MAIGCRGAGIVWLVSLCVLAGCEARPTATGQAAAAGQPARADLDLSWHAESSTLTVELRNTGKTPIRADRELVLLMDIAFLDANDTRLEDRETKSLARPASFGDRFVTVPPGGALRRVVKVGGDYKTFVHGWGTMTEAEGSYHVPVAYEALRRLAPGARPAVAWVNYGSGGFMYGDCIQSYTGSKLAALRLYEGPLRKRISLRR